MKVKYNVLWTKIAEDDLKKIIEYIALDNITIAKDIFLKIQEKTNTLECFPQKGRIIPELHDQGLTMFRELIVTPWRIIYRIADENIYVLSVLDSRQNVEDILLRRFID